MDTITEHDFILVELSEYESQLAVNHGIAIQNANKNIKYEKRPKVGEDSRKGYHIWGAVAEFAFSKKMNTHMDFTVHIRQNGADGITHNGLNYDVKATTKPYGNLVVPYDNPDIDIYALAIVNPNYREVKLIGYAWKDEIICTENWKREIQGIKPTFGWWMPRNELHKFHTTIAGIFGPEKQYDKAI